jgi:glucuronate isomerase
MQRKCSFPDLLFPGESYTRDIALQIYEQVKDLPIVSPHGHTEPRWFAENRPFSDPTALFLTPDHYVLRMLHSHGISYDQLGVPRKDSRPVADARAAWTIFAKNYHLFLGTPSKIWIDHSLEFLFGITTPLSSETADQIYDRITAQLIKPEFLPRSLLDRLKIEVIATTEFALDHLDFYKQIRTDGLIGRIRTTYRPDDLTDPERPNSAQKFLRFGEITGEDVTNWKGLLNAHRKRRETFRSFGATSTDHAVPSLETADLSLPQKQKLLDNILRETVTQDEADIFRAQMLTEMALLSVEDGMVMQIHAGSYRNTDYTLMQERGPDLGADIPLTLDGTRGLQPLLNRYGHERNLRIILFVLDESTYARELAPMAGYWPSLMLGPPWWFHDSPQGIRRYLDQVVETAGFYNLAGFNDDTRALLSIPARHDLWRREICRFLAQLASESRISISSALEIAIHLSYQAAKDAYRIS